MHWLDKLGSAPRAPSPTPPRGAACSTASAACSSAPPSSCRCCRWRARRRRRQEAADRRDRLRLLALLRGGRLPVLLLRRQHDVLPAGHLAIGCVLGRHLPQSAGRQGLPDQLQRLLRQDRLRQVHVRGGRARAAGLSDVPAQRRELVHVERVVHLPLHHVGDRGPGQAQTMNGTRRFVGAAPARGGPGARLAPLAAWSQDRAASGEATLRGGARGLRAAMRRLPSGGRARQHAPRHTGLPRFGRPLHALAGRARIPDPRARRGAVAVERRGPGCGAELGAGFVQRGAAAGGLPAHTQAEVAAARATTTWCRCGTRWGGNWRSADSSCPSIPMAAIGSPERTRFGIGRQRDSFHRRQTIGVVTDTRGRSRVLERVQKRP